MNIKVDVEKSRLNGLKWSLVCLLFIGGLWANYHYSQIDWALRAVGWIVLLCILAVIAYRTTAGKRVWSFSKEARNELRKVVWPTRQETVQTTLIIVAMVICMALILWGIDSILLWIIGWLTGR